MYNKKKIAVWKTAFIPTGHPLYSSTKILKYGL